jgi:broad specificity phosphatase PhoE
MPLLVLRHARAGSRRRWDGPDETRPLSGRGHRQGVALVKVLAPFAPTRILSSPFVRCIQSVEPLGAKLGLAVEPSMALAEGAAEKDVVALAHSLTASTNVLCSHGDVIVALLDALARDDRLELPKDYEYAKGSTWVLHPRKGRYARADYLPSPR